MRERPGANLAAADLVHCYARDLGWDPASSLAPLGTRAHVHDDVAALVRALTAALAPGDHVLIMSNGGFGGVHDKLIASLASRAAAAVD